MRIFIIVLVLIFSFQTLSKANKITEFEIEGMTLGHSALDYFSKSVIKNYEENYYKNKK